MAKKGFLFMFLFLVAVFVILSACNNQTESKEQQIQVEETSEPSGMKRSELALLMRSLYEETQAYGKAELTEGKPFSKELYVKYLEMTTAQPSDPSDTGMVFRAYSNSFLKSLELLTNAEHATIENYNNMVSNCLTCHSQHCPGPMKVIKRMRVKNEAVL